MRARLRLVVLASAVLGCAHLAAAGRAEAQGTDARRAADALFREGRAAAGRGDFTLACARFAASRELDPAVGTTFNLADCQQHLGRRALALTLFRAVLGQLPAGDDWAPIAAARVAELEKQVGTLSVHLPGGAPPGTRVALDGEPVEADRLGSSIPVDPGEHSVAATPLDGPATSVRIAVAAGERKLVELPAFAAPPPDRKGGEGDGSDLRPLGYALGGVGILGLGLGIATGVMTVAKKGVVDAQCNAARQCTPDGLDAASSGRTLGTVSGVAFVAGIAGLAGGTVLILTSRGQPARTALVPSVGPTGGALAVVRAF